MNVVLEGLDLHFSYAGRKILDGVSFEILKNQFTIVLGRNGSGKSTLLRLMAGLLKPEKGLVSVMGRSSKELTSGERARIIGYLPQFHNPVFPFSVEDIVLTGRAAYIGILPKEKDRRATIKALECVGIVHLRQRCFVELSGGERQMVMIARVLAQEPQLILLDEPTAHLDYVNQLHIIRLIRKLANSGFAMVAVFHDPNLAFLHGDRFIFLNQGRVECWSSSQKPWEHSCLEKTYGCPMHSIPYGNRALVVPNWDEI